jgi:hypothetical protein
MEHKYYCTHIKQYKYMKQNIFKLHNDKYLKVLNLGGFWPPTRGNDPTLTIFNGGKTLVFRNLFSLGNGPLIRHLMMPIVI